MSHVFLSYSHEDHFFAELARIKLAEAGISVWVDQGQLRAGEDWRNGIDQGISDCFAVILALSPESASSSFVTYEWASAMGKGKPIVPVRLNRCELHPKLEVIQYLDFSTRGHQPWSLLIERLREIEQDNELPEYDQSGQTDEDASSPDEVEPIVTSILNYLNQRGYQMVSFERIRRLIDENLMDEQLKQLIEQNKSIFRSATLKGGKPGTEEREVHLLDAETGVAQ